MGCNIAGNKDTSNRDKSCFFFASNGHKILIRNKNFIGIIDNSWRVPAVSEKESLDWNIVLLVWLFKKLQKKLLQAQTTRKKLWSPFFFLVL